MSAGAAISPVHSHPFCLVLRQDADAPDVHFALVDVDHLLSPPPAHQFLVALHPLCRWHLIVVPVRRREGVDCREVRVGAAHLVVDGPHEVLVRHPAQPPRGHVCGSDLSLPV